MFLFHLTDDTTGNNLSDPRQNLNLYSLKLCAPSCNSKATFPFDSVAECRYKSMILQNE